MNLDDLLNEMSEKMRNRDLSDEYLREHNNSTREEIGIGEYAYGITMIPCKWVYEYLSDYKRVLKENKELKVELERQKDINTIINQKRIDKNYEKALEKSMSKFLKTNMAKDFIPVQKVKDKIEFLKKEGYWLFITDRDSDKCVEVLQELLDNKIMESNSTEK